MSSDFPVYVRPVDVPRSPAADPDLDRLAEVAAWLAGDAAVEVLARVLPRRDGEEFPELRDRLVRATLDLPRGPVIIAADDDAPTVLSWLQRLPGSDRALLTLRYGERLAPAELARIVGRPRAGVETRLADLEAAVPQPAEAYLSYGLDRLAEEAPGTAAVARAVRVRLQARDRRRRRVTVLAALAALLLIMIPPGAGMLRWYTSEAAAAVGGLQLQHRVDPPAGWRVLATQLTRTSETTTMLGDQGILCRVTVSGEQAGFRSPGREVIVRGQPGRLSDSALNWFSPSGPVAIRCHQSIDRSVLFSIADAVRFESRTFRTPIGLSELPKEFSAPTLDRTENGSTHQFTVGRYDFFVGLTVPPDPGDLRTCPSMGAPPRTTPYDDQAPRVSSTETRFLRTPDGMVCANLRWYTGSPDDDQRDRAERLLTSLGRHLVLAADPADPATWLDAENALPTSRPK